MRGEHLELAYGDTQYLFWHDETQLIGMVLGECPFPPKIETKIIYTVFEGKL